MGLNNLTNQEQAAMRAIRDLLPHQITLLESMGIDVTDYKTARQLLSQRPCYKPSPIMMGAMISLYNVTIFEGPGPSVRLYTVDKRFIELNTD